MTLAMQQWEEILGSINPNKGNILEQIKTKLKEQNEDTYLKWEQKEFHIDYLFNVSFDEYNLKLSLLHLAAGIGCENLIEPLLDNGASVDVTNNDGCTPLYYATENHHENIVESLKRHKIKLKSSENVDDTISNNINLMLTTDNKGTLNHDESSQQENLEKKNMPFKKSIIIGSVCGGIVLLAVGGGCFAAGVALPILAIAGIAVSAALVIGAIAGGISRVVLRPSDDECLSKPQKSVVNSPKSQNKVQSQISDQEPKITIPQRLTEENPKESVSQADTNVKLTENSLNNGSETITTDQQRALSQELVANEPKAAGELKFVDEKLLLVTTSDQFAKCKDYRNTQSANSGKLLMFIKCGANEYRIVGNSAEGSILIKSILRKSEGDKYIDGNILRVEEEIRSVKKMLGLKNGVTEVKVESISNEPFGVKTPTTTAQQTVNNTTIDQPTSSVVLNKSQGNNIVINGIVIPEGLCCIAIYERSAIQTTY